MDSNIKIEDYLSEEETKEIAKQVFKDRCIKEFQNDPAGILMNTAYKMVYKLISDAFDGSLEEHLKKKTLDVINNLSAYTVFGKADSWTASPKNSRGYTALLSSIDKNKEALELKVAELINQIDRDFLSEAITDLIDRKLFIKE